MMHPFSFYKVNVEKCTQNGSTFIILLLNTENNRKQHKNKENQARSDFPQQVDILVESVSNFCVCIVSDKEIINSINFVVYLWVSKCIQPWYSFWWLNLNSKDSQYWIDFLCNATGNQSNSFHLILHNYYWDKT